MISKIFILWITFIIISMAVKDAPKRCHSSCETCPQNGNNKSDCSTCSSSVLKYLPMINSQGSKACKPDPKNPSHKNAELLYTIDGQSKIGDGLLYSIDINSKIIKTKQTLA